MKYTEDHEWLREDDGLIVVGITEHAAEQLGDVVFVELPEAETQVAKGDDIVVIDQGRRIAQGSADELKDMVGGERIEITVAYEDERTQAASVLAGLSAGAPRIENRTITAPVVGGAGALTAALRALDDARIAVQDVGLRRPTLDDVFVSLTGRELEP